MKCASCSGLGQSRAGDFTCGIEASPLCKCAGRIRSRMARQMCTSRHRAPLILTQVVRPNAKPRRRQCLGGVSCRNAVVLVVAPAVVVVTLNDRSGNLIEDERTHIRIALEVEHVIERIYSLRTVGSNRLLKILPSSVTELIYSRVVVEDQLSLHAMRGPDTFTESLFTLRKLDDFVPADHPLRLIRELVNEALRRCVLCFGACTKRR
ncbi:MAG: putative transposase, family [Herminiimonas sp.]|nr:putative transposase, family [Herminiimonas sp.]MDB5854587.1 putative transposase, family [Herminiimonas sp.]